MTKTEAEKILKMVSCGCDGLGVVPGPKGVAVPCPNNCRFVSNEEFKEAREVVQSS